MAILTTECKQRLIGYKAEFYAVYPNSDTIDDPAWVDPEDGTEAPQIPKYTDSRWVDVVVRRFLIRQLQVGDQKIKQAALAAKTFNLEE